MPLDDDKNLTPHQKALKEDRPKPLPQQSRHPMQVDPSGDVPTPTRLPKKLSHQAIKLQENARNVFVAVAPAGDTIEDAKDAGYLWRDSRLRPGDRVEMRDQDFTWLLELLVLERDEDSQTYSHRVLREWILDECELIVASMAGAFVSEMGNGWAVCMGQVVLKGGFKSEQQAGKWLQDKIKTLMEKKGS
jgi:hypothetical protein